MVIVDYEDTHVASCIIRRAVQVSDNRKARIAPPVKSKRSLGAMVSRHIGG